MKDKMKPDYGNWVPTKLLALLYVASLTIAVLLFISILCKWIIPVTIVLVLLSARMCHPVPAGRYQG